MSFSFTAVGSRDEVIEQLGHVTEGTHGTGALGPELAALLAKHLAADEVTAPSPRYRIAYVVTASGHSGGGSATSLTVSLASHYLQWSRA